MAKNRMTIILILFVLVVFVLPIALALSSGKEGFEKVMAKIESEEMNLIYFGSATCPYCLQYDPVIEEFSQEEGFEYTYLDMTELNSEQHVELFRALNKEDNPFGVPFTILVKNGQIVDELRGFNSKENLNNFLVANSFIDGQIIGQEKNNSEINDNVDSKTDNSDSDNINKELLSEVEKVYAADSNGLIVFASSTCPACQRYKPVVEAVKNKKDFSVVYLELDHESNDTNAAIQALIAADYQYVPHSVVVGNEKIISQYTGGMSEDQLIEFLQENEVIE